MNHISAKVAARSAVSALVAAVAAAALAGCSSPSTTNAATSPTGRVSAQSSAAAGGSSTASASGVGTPAASATAGQGNGGSGSSGTAECTDAQLKVTTSPASSASQHDGVIAVFTNTSGSDCSVRGYPGAAVTDHFDKGIVLNATWTSTGFIGGQYPGPVTIVLKPGAAASTILEWLNAPPNGQTPVGANCPGMDGGLLLITPPDTKQSTSFPVPDICGSFQAHPLVAGTSGWLR